GSRTLSQEHPSLADPARPLYLQGTYAIVWPVPDRGPMRISSQEPARTEGRLLSYTASASTQAATPRIFCIGRNYADHIAELGHSEARTCVVFMKPLSALVAAGADIPIPTDQGSVHHELELVVEIGTGGR